LPDQLKNLQPDHRTNSKTGDLNLAVQMKVPWHWAGFGMSRNPASQSTSPDREANEGFSFWVEAGLVKLPFGILDFQLLKRRRLIHSRSPHAPYASIFLKPAWWRKRFPPAQM
jgi:hypothetical protein